jgi:hypothetical protein
MPIIRLPCECNRLRIRTNDGEESKVERRPLTRGRSKVFF